MGQSGTHPAARPRSAAVLVADRPLRAVIAELLREEGWTVHELESSDCERALPAIALCEPAVLVIDPGLDVCALERFVTSFDDRTSAPAFVVLSDFALARDIATQHHVLFVREPFDLDELAAAVEQARLRQTRPSMPTARRRQLKR